MSAVDKRRFRDKARACIWTWDNGRDGRIVDGELTVGTLDNIQISQARSDLLLVRRNFEGAKGTLLLDSGPRRAAGKVSKCERRDVRDRVHHCRSGSERNRST